MDWFLYDRDLRHERVNLHAYGHLLRKKSARIFLRQTKLIAHDNFSVWPLNTKSILL